MAILIQAELVHGVIAKKKNKIPIKIFIWGLINSSEEFIKLTLKIITGILKSITIRLPIVKFLSFNKFIELEIEAILVKIGETEILMKKNSYIRNDIIIKDLVLRLVNKATTS